MALKFGLGLFALGLYASSAFGNVGFWPGDAFFHYNESWAKLPVQYLDPETPRPGLMQSGLHHYHTLITIPDAIVHDWQFGREVEGLAVEIPKGVGWADPRRSRDSPVLIDANRVQIVVITQPDLARYFYQRNDSPFYALTNQGLGLAQFRDGTVVYRAFGPAKQTDEGWGPESHGLWTRLCRSMLRID